MSFKRNTRRPKFSPSPKMVRERYADAIDPTKAPSRVKRLKDMSPEQRAEMEKLYGTPKPPPLDLYAKIGTMSMERIASCTERWSAQKLSALPKVGDCFNVQRYSGEVIPVRLLEIRKMVGFDLYVLERF